jgi:hypothetical protein
MKDDDQIPVSRKLLEFCASMIAESVCIHHLRYPMGDIDKIGDALNEHDEALQLHEKLMSEGKFPRGYYELLEILKK